MQNAKKILTALQSHLNIKDLQSLGDYFGVKRTTVYSWIKNDNITGTGKILAKLPYLNLDWLETGEGPMMIIDENNIDLLPETSNANDPAIKNYVKPKIQARIEPGNDRQKQQIESRKKKDTTKENSSNHDEEEGWEMSEMLQMTEAVLRSSTVYRSTLASNVRAFYQAVKNEEEMNAIAQKLEQMERKDRDRDLRMERMENMLIALGQVLEPQKRDAANE